MRNNDETPWSFSELARHTACALGSPTALAPACAAILVWAASGRILGYSDPWQPVIDTGTAIVTFLMVFLVQNTQDRDARALHLKLDELLWSMQKARNTLIDRENRGDAEIDWIE